VLAIIVVALLMARSYSNRDSFRATVLQAGGSRTLSSADGLLVLNPRDSRPARGSSFLSFHSVPPRASSTTQPTSLPMGAIAFRHTTLIGVLAGALLLLYVICAWRSRTWIWKPTFPWSRAVFGQPRLTVLILIAIFGVWILAHLWVSVSVLRNTPTSFNTFATTHGSVLGATLPSQQRQQTTMSVSLQRPASAHFQWGDYLGPLSYQPKRQSSYTIPYWPFIAVLLFILPFTNPRRKDANSGMCPSCGYDLRATPNRCPECGTDPVEFAADQRNAVGAYRFWPRAVLAFSFVALLFVALSLMAMFNPMVGVAPLIQLELNGTDFNFYLGRAWVSRPNYANPYPFFGTGLLYTSILALLAGLGIWYGIRKLAPRRK
jgi:hypothetical protein